MGNALSHCVRRNDRVKKVSVTTDGVIKKNSSKHAHCSRVCPFFGGCCGRVYVVDSASIRGAETSGRATRRRKGMYNKKSRRVGAPVVEKDSTWAIPKHNFKTFINGNVFITSSNRGVLRKNDSSSIVSFILFHFI